MYNKRRFGLDRWGESAHSYNVTIEPNRIIERDLALYLDHPKEIEISKSGVYGVRFSLCTGMDNGDYTFTPLLEYEGWRIYNGMVHPPTRQFKNSQIAVAKMLHPKLYSFILDTAREIWKDQFPRVHFGETE